MKEIRDLLRQASQNLNNNQKLKIFKRFSTNVVLGNIYHQNHTNYQIDKSNKLLQRGHLGNNEKRQKNQQEWLQSLQATKFRSPMKFRNPCKIGKGLLLLLCFLLFLHSAFWFCSSVFQLISSCSSWIPIFNTLACETNKKCYEILS